MDREEHEITIIAEGDVVGELKRFIEEVGNVADQGAGIEITAEAGDGQVSKMYVDGDGADRIRLKEDPTEEPTAELEEQTQVIGDVVILKIDLPSGTGAIKGKVDTGAEICSLHADQIQMSEGSVKFINKELSDNVITAPLTEKQAVKSSDGGIEYRPVIVLDVVVNDKPVKQVQFNLNDRSIMEYGCLVGQNLLEKTGFMINPSQDDVPHNEVRESKEEEPNWLYELTEKEAKELPKTDSD